MSTQSIAKKILSLFLCTLMLLSLLTTTAFAEDTCRKSGTDYPIVLIHGLMGWGDEDQCNKLLPYWGMTSGNMVCYLRSMGNEVYAASLGPLSSAHDRCCELFAQLTGTRVDYGQAHADSCTAEYADGGYTLTHQRYGRDYTNNAKIKNWGPIYNAAGKVTGWYDNKINMVGHSFGGPTMLEFIDLLANGDADEQAWGKQQAALYGGDWHDYISPLFWGDYDGEYLIHSVTSLSGVLNGTTYIDANPNWVSALSRLAALLSNTIGVSDFAAFYDFQLEQFGLTEIPGTDMEAKCSYLARKGFLYGNDQVFHDLTIESTNAFKSGWDTYSNIYYFSYACNSSHSSGDVYLPDDTVPLIMVPSAAKMGAYTNENQKILSVDGSVCACVDQDWLPNDTLVNTVSARYPFGAAHQAYDANHIRAGVWNVHPDRQQDHLDIVGSLFHPDPCGTHALFRQIAGDIASTVPVSHTTPTFFQKLFHAAVQIVSYPLHLLGWHR